MKLEEGPIEEKLPAQWEKYTGGNDDYEDMQSLLHLAEHDGYEYLEMWGKDGFILRRGSKPIGFINFEEKPFGERPEDRETLYVHSLYVIKSERSPGVSAKLIEQIKDFAAGGRFKYVEWQSTSPQMNQISANLLERFGDFHRISVEKLREFNDRRTGNE